ncbi:hypothetical protein ATCV1_Z255L [Acanthocystis turfacea chlorella virus 1]|uniref:Uncharacterized protein Z255L n=1 Tax=Chlorovirus heliozoae TaxID=322019 RepID=A7K8L5_9PHYC|nr:hypothetical protein ATCV1_Z255L [Acanthocystis turfacea chlorella virus 1]ABT16389.1 hypothetical protein ATCV1_Z255L [Acanthocystis turfacea chlorella virus 1]
MTSSLPLRLESADSALIGIEPMTPWLTAKCSNRLSYSALHLKSADLPDVGLEPTTTRLRALRSAD